MEDGRDVVEGGVIIVLVLTRTTENNETREGTPRPLQPLPGGPFEQLVGLRSQKWRPLEVGGRSPTFEIHASKQENHVAPMHGVPTSDRCYVEIATLDSCSHLIFCARAAPWPSMPAPYMVCVRRTPKPASSSSSPRSPSRLNRLAS